MSLVSFWKVVVASIQEVRQGGDAGDHADERDHHSPNIEESRHK
jgi:hypothetical protein